MLYYSIAQQRLSGEAGGKRVDLFAVSGGGRGRKRGSPEYSLSSFSHQRKATPGVRGGPLPPGFYVVHEPGNHPRLGRAAYLEQTLASFLQTDPLAPSCYYVTDRGGFFIHGRGRHGSDGCIVPMQGFDELMGLLATSTPLALVVRDPGMIAPEGGSAKAAYA